MYQLEYLMRVYQGDLLNLKLLMLSLEELHIYPSERITILQVGKCFIRHFTDRIHIKKRNQNYLIFNKY